MIPHDRQVTDVLAVGLIAALFFGLGVVIAAVLQGCGGSQFEVSVFPDAGISTPRETAPPPDVDDAATRTTDAMTFLARPDVQEIDVAPEVADANSEMIDNSSKDGSLPTCGPCPRACPAVESRCCTAAGACGCLLGICQAQ